MKHIFFLVLLFSFVMASPLSPSKRDMSSCHGIMKCEIGCGFSCGIGTCDFDNPVKTNCNGAKCDLFYSDPFECEFKCGPGCTFTCQDCIDTGFGSFSCSGKCI